jgi:UDP-N-acetylmuramyl pentapeptide synthase
MEKVILVGPVFSRIAKKSEFLLFHDVNKLADHLRADPLKGKTILIKGSRGTGLEKIYDLL